MLLALSACVNLLPVGPKPPQFRSLALCYSTISYPSRVVELAQRAAFYQCRLHFIFLQTYELNKQCQDNQRNASCWEKNIPKSVKRSAITTYLVNNGKSGGTPIKARCNHSIFYFCCIKYKRHNNIK